MDAVYCGSSTVWRYGCILANTERVHEAVVTGHISATETRQQSKIMVTIREWLLITSERVAAFYSEQRKRVPETTMWDSTADGHWGRATVVDRYSLRSKKWAVFCMSQNTFKKLEKNLFPLKFRLMCILTLFHKYKDPDGLATCVCTLNYTNTCENTWNVVDK